MSTTEFVDPADVPASLGDFLDAVGREPLTARMNHATYDITRARGRYRVECYGPGGGWYNAREMSRHELLRYLRDRDALALRRPQSQRRD